MKALIRSAMSAVGTMALGNDIPQKVRPPSALKRTEATTKWVEFSIRQNTSRFLAINAAATSRWVAALSM